MKLTSIQTEAIIRLLSRSGIKYQEIHAELLDHYVNAVEAEIQKGLGFDAALVLVHASFGKEKGLQKMQQKRFHLLKNSFDDFQNLKAQLQLPYVWLFVAFFVCLDIAFIRSGNNYGLIVANILLFAAPGWIYMRLYQLENTFKQQYRFKSLELTAARQSMDQSFGTMLSCTVCVFISTRNPDNFQAIMICIMTALLAFWSCTYSVRFYACYQKLRKQLA